MMDSLGGFTDPQPMQRTTIPYVVAGVALGCLAAPFVFSRKGMKEQIREDREMRENLSEKEIDKTLKDSFPASDPPGRY